VAPTESRVCILGETGTGKELVARAVHERSARRERPFVTVNCAAVPTELIESELFRSRERRVHRRRRPSPGEVRTAHGGTLFLDEVGDMAGGDAGQAAAVLQEGELERVGGERPIAVNAAVIVATHRDLELLVQKGTFREDLYHRIFVFPIVMPPLRDRSEDIPVLAEHFARPVAEQNGWKPRGFEREANRRVGPLRLARNVRELRNVVERLLLLTDDAVDVTTVRQVLAGRHAKPAEQRGSGTLAVRVQAYRARGGTPGIERRTDTAPYRNRPAPSELRAQPSL
jgi:transcriptional regulator with GAF, ATPase, and Fis domain